MPLSRAITFCPPDRSSTPRFAPAAAGAPAVLTCPHEHRRRSSRCSVIHTVTGGRSKTCLDSIETTGVLANDSAHPPHTAGSWTKTSSGHLTWESVWPLCPGWPPEGRSLCRRRERGAPASRSPRCWAACASSSVNGPTGHAARRSQPVVSQSSATVPRPQAATTRAGQEAQQTTDLKHTGSINPHTPPSPRRATNHQDHLNNCVKGKGWHCGMRISARQGAQSNLVQIDEGSAPRQSKPLRLSGSWLQWHAQEANGRANEITYPSVPPVATKRRPLCFSSVWIHVGSTTRWVCREPIR